MRQEEINPDFDWVLVREAYREGFPEAIATFRLQCIRYVRPLAYTHAIKSDPSKDLNLNKHIQYHG